MQSFSLEPGQSLATRYKVIERLGRGSEGEVYKICETETFPSDAT